jgi:two-component system, chemotaxis family, protein-glutamate methylesterase/glutaminase
MTSCLTGRLEDFVLPQVISLLEAVQLSGRLETTSNRGVGQIDFRRGRIVGARLGSFNGEIAAFSILSWSSGEFRFLRDGTEPPGDLIRSNQALCLEAMRLLDESLNPTLSFAPGAEGHGGSLQEPLEQVYAATQSGCRTVKSIAAACQMSALETYYSLECLERAGAVRRQSQEHPRSAEVGASAEVIRVLVVDDSELMRRTLTRLFQLDPSIRVVGAAAGGHEALAMLPTAKPDLITLDLHMPEMDGVTTLKRIMLTEPTPTVIVTASSPDALDQTFEMILRFGAIDFITKPSRSRGEMDEQGRYIHRRLRNAARVNLRGIRLFQPRPSPAPRRARAGDCRALVAAVAGTGGCLSFMQLLSDIPADLPFGVLGLLPFPEDFLRAFVTYMNKYSAFELRLASDGASMASGVCYLTSGAEPWRLVSEEGRSVLRASTNHGPCDPNLLLYDASQAFRERTVGLLLSSESRDLISGLAAVRAGGGMTMGQLPETCVDAEGPAEALKLGLVDKVAVLNRISSDLSQFYMDRAHRLSGQDRTKDGGDTWPRRSES